MSMSMKNTQNQLASNLIVTFKIKEIDNPSEMDLGQLEMDLGQLEMDLGQLDNSKTVFLFCCEALQAEVKQDIILAVHSPPEDRFFFEVSWGMNFL